MDLSSQKASTIKLLACFDFDHTLFEYQPPRSEVIATVLQEEELPVSAEQVELAEFLLRTKPTPEYRSLIKRWPTASRDERTRIILQGREILIRLLVSSIPERRAKKLANLLNESLKDLTSYEPVPEAHEVLQRLRDEEIPLIINSGNVKDIILDNLQRYGLDEFFETIIAVDTHSSSKRDNFQYVWKDLARREQKVLHVGDEPNTDYFAPRSFGIHSYLVIRSSLLHRYARELYPRILERDVFSNLREYADHLLRVTTVSTLTSWNCSKLDKS